MKQGIKMKDAAYPACATVAGCVYFETTADKLIKNSVNNIREYYYVKVP